MGYRSEIGVLITVPDKVNSDKLLTRVCGIINDYDSVELFSKYNHRFIHLHWDWVKWYDAYDDVRKFMDFIRSWEDRYKTGGVHMVRIGEQIEDIEEFIYGEPELFIEVQRSMVISK